MPSFPVQSQDSADNEGNNRPENISQTKGEQSMNPQSQNACIIKGLNNGVKLTPLLALELYGCLRLSARILQLKRMGHQIKTEIITTESGKRVAQYSKEVAL